jgi:hypothetical protein
METWRQRRETWKHGEIETWRHGHGDMDTETKSNRNRKPGRLSLIRSPFAHRANGSFSFANGLNGLSGLPIYCEPVSQPVSNFREEYLDKVKILHHLLYWAFLNKPFEKLSLTSRAIVLFKFMYSKSTVSVIIVKRLNFYG